MSEPMTENSLFKKEIIFEPAFDKRDPDPKKNYGIHGVTMRWHLIGPRGAVQFVVYTNWHLPHVQKEQDARLDSKLPHLLCHPLPADLGYHSPVPMYEEQRPVDSRLCELLGGKPCYYDGSGLNAEPVFELLVTKGSDAVWEELERYYHDTFDKEVSDEN